jgi:endonuclease/exonuclease/phosphatase family metal-dependent hydrolase
LTINLWGVGGDWTARREVLQAGIGALAPDLIALQEAVNTETHDTVAEVVDSAFTVYHQRDGIPLDGVAPSSRSSTYRRRSAG